MSRSKGKHLSKPNREFIEGGVRVGRSARGIAAARFKTFLHSQPRVLAFEPGRPWFLGRAVVRRAGGPVLWTSFTRRWDVDLPKSRSRVISAAGFPPS